LGIKFIETSAKNSVNEDSAFFTMAKEKKDRVQVENPTADKSGGGGTAKGDRKQLGGGKAIKKDAGCC